MRRLTVAVSERLCLKCSGISGSNSESHLFSYRSVNRVKDQGKPTCEKKADRKLIPFSLSTCNAMFMVGIKDGIHKVPEQQSRCRTSRKITLVK